MGEQLLVGQESAHDVLRRVGAVDPDDQVLRPPVAQLSFLDHDSVRIGKAGRARDIDGYRVSTRVDDAPLHQHRLFTLVDCQSCVLLARHQEVAHVEARLEADDVAPEQAIEDCIPHLTWQHLPVLRRRPRDVDEVLDDRPVQLLANELRHEVELIVMDHDQWPSGESSCHVDDPARDLLVDLHVSVLPGPVDPAVDDRLMREVPQVVLDEPQHRVGDHRVVLLVLLGCGSCVVEPGFAADEGCVPGRAVLLDQRALTLGSGARDPIRRRDLGQRQQRGDHPARAPCEAPLRTRLVRGAVGDDDR